MGRGGLEGAGLRIQRTHLRITRAPTASAHGKPSRNLEEANILASANRLVGVYTNLTERRVIFDFLGSWLSGDARNGEETLDVSWVPKTDADKMINHPGYSRRLRQLLSFDGRVLFQSYTTSPFTVRAQEFV